CRIQPSRETHTNRYIAAHPESYRIFKQLSELTGRISNVRRFQLVQIPIEPLPQRSGSIQLKGRPRRNGFDPFVERFRAIVEMTLDEETRSDPPVHATTIQTRGANGFYFGSKQHLLPIPVEKQRLNSKPVT